jgi:hypothetical protein
MDVRPAGGKRNWCSVRHHAAALPLFSDAGFFHFVVFVFYLNLYLVSTSTFDKHQLVLPVIHITQQCDVVSCLEDPKELQLIFFAGLKLGVRFTTSFASASYSTFSNDVFSGRMHCTVVLSISIRPTFRFFVYCDVAPHVHRCFLFSH